MNTISLSAAVCRWMARIIGTLLFAVVVLLAIRQTIGGAMPNPTMQLAIVQLGLVALALILIGILIGWCWELTGGSLSLVGTCLFYVPAREGHGLTFFWFLAIPGMLYITSYLLARYASRRSKT